MAALRFAFAPDPRHSPQAAVHWQAHTGQVEQLGLPGLPALAPVPNLKEIAPTPATPSAVQSQIHDAFRAITLPLLVTGIAIGLASGIGSVVGTAIGTMLVNHLMGPGKHHQR